MKKSHYVTKEGMKDFVLLPFLYLVLFGCVVCILMMSSSLPFNEISHILIAKEVPSFEVEEKKEETIVQSVIEFPELTERYGTIRVERAELEESLCYGDDEITLKRNIGQYEFSGFPGQGRPILLAGHNGTIFKRLRYVEIGDIVEIETNYGIYHYEVIDTDIVDVNEWDVTLLEKQEELLMMYTCYPFDQLNVPDRYFVYARYMDGVKIVNE